MESTIALTLVKSTQIAAYGYDSERRILEVELTPNATLASAQYLRWQYADVSPEKWEGFQAAPSKGVYFYRAILGKHEATRAPAFEACPLCGDHGLSGCTCEECGRGVYGRPA